jgi:hypothetical protein
MRVKERSGSDAEVRYGALILGDGDVVESAGVVALVLTVAAVLVSEADLEADEPDEVDDEDDCAIEYRSRMSELCRGSSGYILDKCRVSAVDGCAGPKDDARGEGCRDAERPPTVPSLPVAVDGLNS